MNNEVIFCNNLRILKKILKNKKDKTLKYLVVRYNKEAFRITDYLRTEKNIELIDGDGLRVVFQRKFVKFISELNKENQSTFWWCLNFTNKNPITTNLCSEMFNFLLITNALKNKINLLVVTDNLNLFKQVSQWSKNNDIKVIKAIKTRFYLKNSLKKFLPLAILFAYLRTFLFKICISVFCSTITIDRKKEYSALMSLVNHQSFTKNGSYSDAYFGDLLNFLKKINIPFLILGEILFPPYVSVLKKAVFNKQEFLFVPKEYFLTYKDLSICLFHSLVWYFKPVRIKGKIAFEGNNVGYLVKEAIKEDCISTKFFSNICFYYCVKRLVKQLEVNKFYYPFENRSFEKMSILAIRKFSPKTKIIGYQHASISQRHTNLFLDDNEYKMTPMPNQIITMGEITSKIMRNKGNFPNNLIKIGCGLRQCSLNGNLKEKKERISNLLVALATNIEEYVKVLKFLNEAFQHDNFYKIWIRPHPVFSLEEAIEVSGQPKFKFHKSNKESLQECYKWADLVLYVHSTLSLEALSFGIPVINIVTSDCLNPDPLFNFEDLKWSVSNPRKLKEIISLIDSIPKGEFLSRQKKAKEYTEKYIYPVNEQNLKVFIDV